MNESKAIEPLHSVIEQVLASGIKLRSQPYRLSPADLLPYCRKL